MSSYQYNNPHCGDKTVVRSSYLHDGILFTGEMASLYGISPLEAISTLSFQPCLLIGRFRFSYDNTRNTTEPYLQQATTGSGNTTSHYLSQRWLTYMLLYDVTGHKVTFLTLLLLDCLGWLKFVFAFTSFATQYRFTSFIRWNISRGEGRTCLCYMIPWLLMTWRFKDPAHH